MTTKAQPRNNKFARRIKRRLFDADMSVADLARSIHRPRQSVSAAIHRGRFPKIRKQITDFLYA